MLGKAPGTELLNEWYGVYNASVGKGMSPEDALLELANHIAASSAFTSMYPFFVTNEEFARDFLTAALGEAPSAEVLALATGLLDGGMGRGEMGLLAVRQLFEIRMQGESHPAYGDFGAIAMMFANKVQVATYYTVEKRWEGASSSVLGGVTDDGDSVDMAKEAIDMMRRPGKSFELTTGVDRLDGTLGDDTFVATEKTLTGVDRIDGGEGMDTLELSSSGSDDDVNISSGASVMNIETLTVDSGGDFSADLSGWEGLTEVVLSDVAGDVELDAGGADVMSESLGDDDKDTTIEIVNAASVNLEDVNARAQVNIFGTDTTTSVMVEGGKGVEVGKSTAHSETVKSVTLDGVHDGMGDDGKRYGKNEPAKAAVPAVPAQGETPETPAVAAVPAKNNKDSVPVHIYSKAIESVDLRNTNTTLLVENAAEDMTELTAMVDRFGLYSAATEHGKLCLKGIEDLTIEVKGDSNIRLASDQIKTVAVSGAGNLMLDVTKFAPAAAEKAADVMPSATLESIDASEASGAVKIAKLNKSVTSYMGSMGKDDVSATAFNAEGLTANLGAGDDMFTVANVKAGKSRIDGGDGMDTLVLKEKTGANLKGAGDAYTGFETITLEAGEGSGTYDVKGLDIDNLKVTGGTGTGGVVFKNLTSGTDLAVASKKPDSNDKAQATTAAVSYMLADGEEDGEFVLHLHTSGGKMDKKSDLRQEAPRKAKINLTLTLDPDIEEMTLHSTATATSTVAGDKATSMDYMNTVSIKNGNKLEELKITGDAVAHIVEDADSLLSSLQVIDARGSSGGVYYDGHANRGSSLEIHGSSAGDYILPSGGTDDDLMGNGGDDALLGSSGKDTITGGAGGDAMIGGKSQVISPKGEWAFIGNAGFSLVNDSAEDIFVYDAASDSQVDLDKMTGFDSIFFFDADNSNVNARDKIKISPVVDLQGSVYYRGSGAPTGVTRNTGDEIDNTKSLKQIVDDHADGMFRSKASGSAFGELNSIVWLESTEAKDKFTTAIVIDNTASSIGIVKNSNKDLSVTWLLVDVDGDGDFDADIDMAIALMGNSNYLNAESFI